MRVLPGVETLMTALTDVALAPQIGLGLVTGNVAGGADLKLRGPRLRDPFLIGAFGSDSEERNHLPGLALERARRHWSTDFAAERVWVIGDTPRDVECGQAHGLRTLAVATGNFSAEVLEATGADAVVEDFSDTSAVIDLLMDAPNRT
jgi:phosphoglycolate phosphatase-like HAD superfamily hydrolase